MMKYNIIDEIEIDPGLGIKAILRSDSRYWKVQYNLPGTGQKRKSLRTTSKKKARQKGYEFARQFDAGEIQDRAGTVTVGSVIEAHAKRLAERGRENGTLGIYNQHARTLLGFLPRGGKTPLMALTADTLEAFESKLREGGIIVPSKAGSEAKAHCSRPRKPKSVRETLKYVRGLVSFALKRGWISRDPGHGYELPPLPKTEILVFSAEEPQAINEDPFPGMGDIWQFLTQTCLRAQEFTWLCKDDVLLNGADQPVAIQIRAKVCPQTGEKWKPKHGVERQVPLTKAAADIVLQAMDRSASPWVFEAPDSRGAQFGKWTYQPLLRKLHDRLAACGIARTGLHRFRHTGATYLANNANMPIAQLQQFLGHRDIRDTMKYLHPRAEHVNETIRRINFGDLMGNVTGITNAKVEITI